MGARAKLNSMFLYAAAIVAAVVGAMAQSWAVFAVTLAGCLIAGDIRPKGRR